MNWGAMLILCILLSSSVLAENVKLSVGESYLKYGVNITLAKLDKDYEKAVICVNNEKQIMEDDQLTYFRDARIELNDIDRHDRSIEFDVKLLGGCVGCICEGDCLNSDCKINIYDEFGSLIYEEENEVDVIEEPESIKIIEQRKVNKNFVVVFGLIGGLIGAVLVWLFWFRKMTF